LEENVAANQVKLTAEELLEIDKVFPEGVAAGSRYTEQMMRMIDVA
jgi:hypothetical protein